jgi:hypothetical protein
MRVLVFLVGVLATTVAGADVFDAERGQWMIANTSTACRALNRPPADFNYAPYDALQIVARANNTIGVEVFFWPKAIDPSRDYRLQLNFSPGSAVTLDAKPAIGDYMVSASDDASRLSAMFQKATTLVVTVEGEPRLDLFFGLDDISWVLTKLQSCARLLPKT